MNIIIWFEYYNVNSLAFQMKVFLNDLRPFLIWLLSIVFPLPFLFHPFSLYIWAVVPTLRYFKILFFLHKLCFQDEIFVLTASFVPRTTYLTHKWQLKLKSVSKYVVRRFSFLLLFIDNAPVLSIVWAHGGH